MIYSHRKKNEELIKTLISQTFCSQNILLWKISKFTTLSSVQRNEDPFHENSRPRRKQSRRLPLRSGELQALQDLAWLPRANCHMFQLVGLWMMIYFYYFWQSLSYSFGQ